jgi:hypothetical protein
MNAVQPQNTMDEHHQSFEPCAMTETIGTSLQGVISVSYADVCKVFGKEHDGCKIDAEWCVKFSDGTIATIYNYKDGKNYCGESGLETSNITNWHIGGHGIEAKALVWEALFPNPATEAIRATYKHLGRVRASVVEVLPQLHRKLMTLDMVSKSTGSESMPGNVSMEIDAIIALLTTVQQVVSPKVSPSAKRAKAD